MKLYFTPRSHFSRKIRILLELYSIPCEFINIGNVASSEKKIFSNNPLMKVPVLVDQENTIIESDHIAQYIVQKYDREDKYNFFSKDLFDLNVRAMLNGIMSEEVKIILAKRTDLPIEKYSFFDKAYESVTLGLEWLEERSEQFDMNNFSYREIHLICAIEYLLNFYKLVPKVYPKLQNLILQSFEIEAFFKTAPI